MEKQTKTIKGTQGATARKKFYIYDVEVKEKGQKIREILVSVQTKKGHGGGLALVGEKRRELVITPSGQMFYTPNKPTIMDLPRDSHVIPNPDAMSEMAKIDAINGLKNINFGGGFDVSGLRFDIKDLKRAILNKPEVGYDFDKGLKYIKRGGNKDYFVNSL